MQGHVIVLLHQEELMGECVLCDMGGGTNDIMGLIDGKPTGQLFIDKNAALNLYQSHPGSGRGKDRGKYFYLCVRKIYGKWGL